MSILYRSERNQRLILLWDGTEKKKYKNEAEVGVKASTVQTTTNACIYPHLFGCNWVGATFKAGRTLD